MSTHPSTQRKWIPLESDWVMYNVGLEYSKSKGLIGGVWMLRNEKGMVLCHNRRTFSGINIWEDAKFVAMMWALESMRSQRQSKIIFAGKFKDLFGATVRPQAWPSFFNSFPKDLRWKRNCEGSKIGTIGGN